MRTLLPSSIKPDPFDSLPIQMTKKSPQIFHHCTLATKYNALTQTSRDVYVVVNRFRFLTQIKAPSEYE